MTCILVDGDEKSRGFESTPTANRSPPAMTTLPELTRSIFENERMASKQLNTKVTDSGAHCDANREQVHPPLFGSEPG
jgi:hypothetical protein